MLSNIIRQNRETGVQQTEETILDFIEQVLKGLVFLREHFKMRFVDINPDTIAVENVQQQNKSADSMELET